MEHAAVTQNQNKPKSDRRRVSHRSIEGKGQEKEYDKHKKKEADQQNVDGETKIQENNKAQLRKKQIYLA